MKKILIICSGNTCRSPMAEAIMRKKAGDGQYEITSAGLMTVDGLPATEFAQQAVAEYGASLAAHQSRHLTAEQLNEADLVICMTGEHYDALCARYPAMTEKFLMLLPEDVSDPFGGDLQTYRQTAEQIAEGVDRLINWLSQEDKP